MYLELNYSKALDGLVRGFELRDMWRADPLRTVFTHFSPLGESRIDRIYTKKEPGDKDIGVGLWQQLSPTTYQ